MESLKARWKAELPQFWKRVRTLGITVLGSCMAIWLANSSLNLGLDETILTVCKYGIAIGAATGINAQLTKK